MRENETPRESIAKDAGREFMKTVARVGGLAVVCAVVGLLFGGPAGGLIGAKIGTALGGGAEAVA